MQNMKKTKNNFSRKTLALVASIGLQVLVATDAFATCNYNDFQGWKNCFIKDQLSHKLNSVDVDVLQQAKYSERTIELDKKQPEKKLTFERYIKLIALDQKVSQGRKFYAEHKSIVDSIAQEYNVEPGILVALIGIESHFGMKQGDFNIIDSLASLAYDGRRKQLFEKELINALQMARNENLSYDEFKGSWAGAMGQCQFMPSSYLSYAVDHDRDGKADIWNSVEDAVASAANYLKKSGWDKGATSINPLRTDDGTFESPCANKEQICKFSKDLYLISLKDSDINTAFEVGSNFDVLMKWNRSLYFGLAVLMIADRIE